MSVRCKPDLPITIGADPEFFLEQNGNMRSAIDRIGGSKDMPRPLGRTGFMVQEDNVAVEFNIPPAKTMEEFVESIQWSIAKIGEEVKVYGYKPSFKASALFPPTELKDARALAFGCDPDYNAWKKGERNPRPHSDQQNLRSAGGHVHVGYPNKTPLDRLRLIQMMDLYLGVPSVMMDEDLGRRELYGKAGAYRPQDYGVEYRTLSNFWLKDSKYMQWVYEQTLRAVQAAIAWGKPLKNGKPDKYTKFLEKYDLSDDIQEAINNSNPNVAQRLIVDHDLVLVV